MNFRRILYIAGLMILLSSAVAYAGTLDPTDPPGSTNAYTLEDIYQRLAAGTVGTPSTWTEPTAGPGSTMHTLDEIMGAAPLMDDIDGAGTADVANGKTFWGLTGGEWGLQTGTAVSGGVDVSIAKTGQTASYYSGDDGDLERGAAWPSPRFIDNLDGTVTDNLTDLMWMMDAGCMGTMTWTSALTETVRLNSGIDFSCDSYTPGTYSDWQLPNVREQLSLIDYGQDYPSLPSGHPFNEVRPSYWTSTSSSNQTDYAFYASLDQGTIGRRAKSGIFNVWPVRSGQ